MSPAPHAPLSAPRPKRWLWFLAAASVLAMAWGLWRAMDVRHSKQAALQAQQQAPTARLQIPSSEWLRVESRVLRLGLPITGSLAALDSATVKARVPGELRDLRLREGDAVQAGDVVARVDATESEARFRQAKLQADAAQAQLAIQQRQFDNNRALVDRGFISNTALATSQANLQAAQANYAAARAAQDGARKTLDDTVLRSPITGHVTRRFVHNGERVNIEAPILEVVNADRLELEVAVAANDSAQVALGQQAELRLRSSQGAEVARFHAQVVRINPAAQEGSRTVAVYLRVQPSPAAGLRPGMYAEGIVATGTQETLAVPLSAVRTDQPQTYVQAVRDGAVQHLPVRLGARSVTDDEVWVAIEGIEAQTPILTARVGAIPAGTPVALQAPSPSAP